jgi:uncharacterized LabA/DUF88 family protein
MNRVAVYVDGFNLFYALRAAKAKWLNLGALCDGICGKVGTVEHIKYFTAHVDGDGDQGRPMRQQAYIRAISTDERVSVYLGSFMRKRIDRPVERLLIANSTLFLPDTINRIPQGLHRVVQANGSEKCLSVHDRSFLEEVKPRNPVYARVLTREEKGSDVNLSVTMLNDAWRNEYDTAIVLSNDSDLCEPIRIVCSELCKKVVIGYVPQDPKRVKVSDRLKVVASGVFHVKWPMLRRNQLPDKVITRTGSVVTKPEGW